MMRLAWLSDLHLDMVSKEVIIWLGNKIKNADCEAAIVTGDIASAASRDIVFDMLAEAAQKKIYFINGNHDFYSSSFSKVRSRTISLSESSKYLVWVQAAGVIPLTKKTCLIGHDGWYDGRNGDYFGYSVNKGWMPTSNRFFELNDFTMIDDLKAVPDREAKYHLFNNLGDQAANYIKEYARTAAQTFDRILMITHVPPFEKVSMNEGRVSSVYALPFYSSKAMGEALLDLKEEFPDKEFIVFCGHTHSPAELHIDNLTVYVAGAIYGDPGIYTIITLQD